jgi:hypothetical protein
MPTIRMEGSFPGGGQIPWPALLPVTLPTATANELVAAGKARLLAAPGTVRMETVFPGGGWIPLAAGETLLVPQRIADALVSAGMAVITAADATPTLTSINPTTAVVGSAVFTLHCLGSGFTFISEVYLGLVGVPTTFVNAGEVTVSVDPSLFLAGPVSVTVRNGVLASAPRTLTFTATAGDPPDDPPADDPGDCEPAPKPKPAPARAAPPPPAPPKRAR